VHEEGLNWISWRWNTVPGADGYKWNTSDNYTTAIQMGTDTINLEDGLAGDSIYTRYVWAYDDCSHSAASQLTATTSTCGSTLIINHVAGEVAPVNKVTTYGTVTNIPGESTKCWISQNLGSDNQATAVSDNTEPSAGWYWQFNTKRGYKHDGTNVTPAWIFGYTYIITNWSAGNDPCTIELGPGWRIPTYTEYYNIDNTGSWANWYGPWNSNLKIHAAGYLAGGALNNRGTKGYYWSSSNSTIQQSYNLYFESTQCFVNDDYKDIGFALRCVID
jgi:hypothetical protein